jgi:hypothetical membrane protein
VSSDKTVDGLLWAAVAAPIVYFTTVIVASLFYPGYSHVTRYASELGSASAPYPMLFNVGILTLGMLAILGGLGYQRGLRSLQVGRVLSLTIGLVVGLFGVSMILGGLFPMPDERHGGFGLGLGVHLGPRLLLIALRRRRDLGALRIFLATSLVLMVALFAIMMGAGGLVSRANVGLFQRAYALTLFPWIGVGAWYVLELRRTR